MGRGGVGIFVSLSSAIVLAARALNENFLLKKSFVLN